MSKLSKVLSVLLAMVLLFSTASIGVEAAYTAYKDGAITRYDSIDKPVLTPAQYASMAMDEVDRMLGEANLKIKYDLAGLIAIEADFTSIDKALDSIADIYNDVKSMLPTIGGDVATIDFSALVNSDGSLACPKRTTAGRTDADIFYSLLEFLNDNAETIAKVPKGTLDLGILSGFIDLGDKLNIPKLVKELLAGFVDPDTPKAQLDTSKTVDQYVEAFIEEIADGSYADYADGVGFLQDASKLIVKYLPGITQQIDFLDDTVYTILDKGVKILLNAVAVPYANPRVKAALNRLCGYDYYKTTDEDGDTIWKRVEENPQDDLNAMVNVINTDFNLDPFPVESWGDDWIFDHLNDIVGQIVREAIKPEIEINWSTANGNEDLKPNVIAVAKTILKNTGDALFANYIEVLSPDEIDAMEDGPFMAYVLRSILNASISYVFIPNTCEDVLSVLFELVKQIAADFVPWRDYSDLDADIDGIMAMGLDMAVYGLNGITNMDLDYGLDVEEFADEAMNWVIENYGGFVSEVEGNDGWAKLSYVIFNIIPANWLSTREDGSERDNIYDLLMTDIVENAIDLNFDGILSLLDKNEDGELNTTIIEVIMARLTNIVNYILPDVFPEADYSALENLLDPDLLGDIVMNLLSSLYDRAQNGLLDAALPVVCAVLGLSSPESFGYPYISLEDQHTAPKTLGSFYMYNGSAGINTNATDKNGNTPTIPDKLYTYRILSVTTNNSSIRVTPSSNITINGGTSQTFTFTGDMSDAVDTVLKVTITYDVYEEKGVKMTQNPLTATTYTYIYDASSVTEDTEKAKADANDKNTHLIYYTPTTYLSKGSKLSSLTDYSMDLQRNKWKDSSLHNQDATFALSNASLDSNLAALGVSVQPISISTMWKGGLTEYEPYVATDDSVEIPEGSYTNNFFFNATKTEQVAEAISFTHNIFVYDDFGLGSLLSSAVRSDRQRANYGNGTYTAEYPEFGSDPKDENPEMVTETVNGAAAWNRYNEAVDAAAAIIYAPRQVSTMQTFVDNGDFEMAAYELYCATKELDACSTSGGTAGIKSALEAIVAPDTFINEYGEEETYDYDDARRTYFGRSDYVNYTYGNFKGEMRAAQSVLDAEKAAIKKGETYQIESIRAAYLAHRVSLYGERLVRVRAYKTYLNEAIENYTDLYEAGQGTYSNKTWNDFTRAYAFATAVNAEEIGATISGSDNLVNDGLRQSKVNEARAQLVKAAKRLTEAVPTVDYTQILALIDRVKPTFQAGNDEGTYTELSWNTFVSAYRDAQDIVDDELEDTPANQTKVNNAYNALNAAYDGLETVVVGGDWNFTDDTFLNVAESLYSAYEYVTGMDEYYINVSDFVEASGAYEFEVELNEYDMESTGAILRITNGDEVIGEYPIVYYGDINGDGISDATDMTELVYAMATIGLTEWEDFAITDENAHAWAADLNHDAVLDGTDTSIMVELQGYIIAYNQAWVDGDEPFEYI